MKSEDFIDVGKAMSEGFARGIEQAKAVPKEWVSLGKMTDEGFAEAMKNHPIPKGWVDVGDLTEEEQVAYDEAVANSLAGRIASAGNALKDAIRDAFKTSVEQELQEALRKSDEQNLQLRRANSKLKSSERHLKRVIRGYKEQLEQAQPHKHKYRNRNHQGDNRGGKRR